MVKKLIIIRETVSLIQDDLAYQCAMKVWIACVLKRISSVMYDIFIWCKRTVTITDNLMTTRTKSGLYLLEAKGTIQR